jgi:hypothetical protein
LEGFRQREQLAAQRLGRKRAARAATRLRGRVAVRQVGGDARRVGDIVQRQLAHQRVHLQQQRQRLADAAGSAQHHHLRPRGARERSGIRDTPPRRSAGRQKAS